MSHGLALQDTGKPGWLTVLRTRRLASDRTRRKAAHGVERAIRAADTPRQSLSSAVPIAHDAVVACRWQLAALAEALRRPGPVYAQGVALTLELLSNADSPLYQADGDLEEAILEIRAALDGNLE
jgi:hypothetical protein